VRAPDLRSWSKIFLSFDSPFVEPPSRVAAVEDEVSRVVRLKSTDQVLPSSGGRGNGGGLTGSKFSPLKATVSRGPMARR
jgi:hypothetical protein